MVIIVISKIKIINSNCNYCIINSENNSVFEMVIIYKLWYYFAEEVFNSNVGHWWSPDSKYILYAIFNDTNVPMYKFPYYDKSTNIYGDINEIAYPKVMILISNNYIMINFIL